MSSGNLSSSSPLGPGGTAVLSVTPSTLFQMVQTGNSKAVAALAKQGGSSLLAATNAQGQTALHVAVVTGNLSVVRKLLRGGAPIDAASNIGATPLHYAVLYRHRAIADLLLSEKADPSVQNAKGETPLHIAVMMNDRAIAEALLAAGSNPALTDALANTPLMLAAKINPGLCSMFELFERAGSDKFDVVDKKGWLAKLSHTKALKVWNMRFCTLKGPVFSYYTSPKDRLPSLELVLTDDSLLLEVVAGGYGKQRFVFSISRVDGRDFPGKTFGGIQFAAESEGDLRDWVLAMSAARRAALFVGSNPSSSAAADLFGCGGAASALLAQSFMGSHSLSAELGTASAHHSSSSASSISAASGSNFSPLGAHFSTSILSGGGGGGSGGNSNAAATAAAGGSLRPGGGWGGDFATAQDLNKEWAAFTSEARVQDTGMISKVALLIESSAKTAVAELSSVSALVQPLSKAPNSPYGMKPPASQSDVDPLKKAFNAGKPVPLSKAPALAVGHFLLWLIDEVITQPLVTYKLLPPLLAAVALLSPEERASEVASLVRELAQDDLVRLRSVLALAYALHLQAAVTGMTLEAVFDVFGYALVHRRNTMDRSFAPEDAAPARSLVGHLLKYYPRLFAAEVNKSHEEQLDADLVMFQRQVGSGGMLFMLNMEILRTVQKLDGIYPLQLAAWKELAANVQELGALLASMREDADAKIDSAEQAVTSTGRKVQQLSSNSLEKRFPHIVLKKL